jgi:hypothetical protein
MTRAALGLTCLALFLVVPIGAAYRTGRYCLNPDEDRRWHRGQHTITVRLHTSLVNLCGGHAQSCSTSNVETARRQIERAVMTALADFHHSGANLQFVLSGWTSSASRRENSIVIAHYSARDDGPCPPDYRALANNDREPWYEGGDDRGLVLLCSEMEGGRAVRWTPWAETFGSGDVISAFIPTVKHEFLHVLGLGHSNDPEDECTVATDAINATMMRASGFTFEKLAREDIRFLLDHFGARENDSVMSVTQNGVTWQTASGAAPAEAARAIGRPAATNSGEGSHLFVAWRDASEDAISVSRYTSSDSWRLVSSVSSRNAPYFPAIAYASDRNIVLAYQRHDAGPSSSTLRPVVRASSDGGATWTSEFVRDGVSPFPGISASHDPASGEWLLFAAGSSVPGRGRRIRYFSLSTQDEPDDLPQSWLTGDVPSAACGPPAETDPYNCIVTWLSDAWDGSIYWTQCRVTTPSPTLDTKLECLPARNMGYLSVASAPVAYAGPAGGFPWQIGLSQGGGSIFTWRKAGSPTANWSDQRSLSYPPEAGIPALGSQERTGSNRLFLTALAQQ